MDATIDYLPGFDGTRLAVHRLGPKIEEGARPLVLLHGLFSNAEVNWIKYGTAKALAAAGFACVMPDWRAHGRSAAPHEPEAYPHDALVKDLVALIGQLGLDDYDLAGFSLGARTALRGVSAAGLTPRRLVLGGMGLAGLHEWDRRVAFFLDVIARFGTIPREDQAYMAQNFMRSTKVDLVATRLLLESFAGSTVDDLAQVTVPTLVVCGREDHDNGSAEELAGALPDARFAQIPGNHMSSVTRPELAEEMAAFLAD